VRSPPPEEEALAETSDELTVNPIPHSPALLRGEELQKMRNEVEPGKKGGVGERCFKIWFYFSLSHSDLIGNKLN